LNNGKEMHDFCKELWPINRSITGNGVRETLEKIKLLIPGLIIKSIPTGAKVFDWEVPKEWRMTNAYIKDPDGNFFCDFTDNNLHIVGYSIPVHKKMQLQELQDHLHSLPDQPNAIPYVTSYYKERWGFCMTHEDRLNLQDGEYEVVVDSELFKGELNYAELIIKGESKEEVFLSTYICHPSMANNELSGPAVVTFLVKWLLSLDNLRYTYRIIFIPETIGSIAYLSQNYKQMKKNTIAGFNVTCVGDDRVYSYLPSRFGNVLSDHVAKHVLKWTDSNFISYTWQDRGSDERQYCSPGIDLPIATMMRSKYGEYPEYHTSLDDLNSVVTADGLEGGFNMLKRALEVIEHNDYYKVTVSCEPQMGKRGLYPTLSTKKSNQKIRLMMNFISWCDGGHSVLQIADILNVPVWELYEIADTLVKHKVLKNN